MANCVVFFRHTEVARILHDGVPNSMVLSGATKQEDRQDIIDAFQAKDPKCRVLIVHTEIGSTALTLTASNNVIFAETEWVPKDVQQGVKRVHRIGQVHPVLARIVCLKGSLDEHMTNSLVRKARSSNAFYEAITEVGD